MDMKEVEEQIQKLESGETTWNACQQLAVLYAVKDHVRLPSYSYSAGGSAFLKAVDGAPTEAVMSILDAHFDCIKEMFPKEYAAVLRKIEKSKA